MLGVWRLQEGGKRTGWYKELALTNCRGMKGPASLEDRKQEKGGVQSLLVPKWLYNGTQHWKTRKQPALQIRPPVVAQDGGLDPRALSKSIPELRSLDT